MTRAAAYVLYAQGLLPFLLPLSVLLIEPTRDRRRRNAWLSRSWAARSRSTFFGGLSHILCRFPPDDHGIVYLNQISTTTLVAILYVTATCGALFFSGFRPLVLLAWLNLVGLLVVMVVQAAMSLLPFGVRMRRW